jgi:hypothetical protein
MCFVCAEIALIREVLGAIKRGEADMSHLALALLVACPGATHIHPGRQMGEIRWYGVSLGAQRAMFVNNEAVAILVNSSALYESHYVLHTELGKECLWGRAPLFFGDDQTPGEPSVPDEAVCVPEHTKPHVRRLLLDTIQCRERLVDEVSAVLPVRLLPELVAAYARPSGVDLAKEAGHPRPARCAREGV